MKRGRPWHTLQSQVFAMADNTDVHTREAAFRVFAGCPNLIMDLQTDAIFAILQKGLQDQQSTEVSIFHSRATFPTLALSDVLRGCTGLLDIYRGSLHRSQLSTSDISEASPSLTQLPVTGQAVHLGLYRAVACILVARRMSVRALRGTLSPIRCRPMCVLALDVYADSVAGHAHASAHAFCGVCSCSPYPSHRDSPRAPVNSIA